MTSKSQRVEVMTSCFKKLVQALGPSQDYLCVACEHNKGPDQPAYPLSLIMVIYSLLLEV